MSTIITEPVQLDGCFLFEQLLLILNIPFTDANVLNPKLYDELLDTLKSALHDLHVKTIPDMERESRKHGMGHLVFDEAGIKQTIHTCNFMIDQLTEAKEMILASEGK